MDDGMFNIDRSGRWWVMPLMGAGLGAYCGVITATPESLAIRLLVWVSIGAVGGLGIPVLVDLSDSVHRFAERRLTRWLGPPVGAAVGALGGFKAAGRTSNPEEWLPLCLLIGAACGAAAGTIILFIDPEPTGGSSDDSEANGEAGENPQSSGLEGRFLAVAGVSLCWTGYVGLVLSLIGLAVNWNSKDWARTASIVGCLLGALSSIILTVLLIVAFLSRR